MQKLLLLHVAALGYDLLQAHGVTQLAGLPLQPLTTTDPAVTCSAQATLRTAQPPQAHGMCANGIFVKDLYQTQFWNQSARLVKGPRIWDAFRSRGGKVGLYFFQQSLGETVDECLSPAPIHTHGGGLIMATYAKPQNLLNGRNPLPLWRYWGPLASPKVGRAIVSTIKQRLTSGTAPEVCLVYLPTLDYDLQRYGTHHRTTPTNVREICAQIEDLVSTARAQGYEIVIAGDYAITDVTGTVAFPNRVLHAAGLMQTRTIRGMLYPDLYTSTAFALCDHQTALVYCQSPEARTAAYDLLKRLPEVDHIELDFAGADLKLTAKAGCWFAYPWWETSAQAPDYATHVDIHNKPGFDPCELFFGKTPFTCSTDVSRIRGTHGRNDAPIAWASSLPIDATSLETLATAIQQWLEA